MEIRSLGCMLRIQIFWVYLVRSISLLCAGWEEYMTRKIFLSAHYPYHSPINAIAKVIPNHIAFFAFLSRPTFAAGPLFLVDHFIHSWFVKAHRLQSCSQASK